MSNISEKIVSIIKENIQAQPVKKKQTKVRFDSATESPFDVIFSERGFSINGTRMSFELLEEAIRKNFHISLDNGSGIYLDAVKMQKILKYKTLY